MPLTDKEIKAFSDTADMLRDHVKGIARTLPAIVSSINKANDDISAILKPVEQGSSPLANSAREALNRSKALNDRLVLSMAPTIARTSAQYEQAMNGTGFTAYELAMLEDAGGSERIQDRQELSRYLLIYRISRAEWSFFSNLAYMQVGGLVDELNVTLCAYLGFRPGQRTNISAFAKEASDKLRDGVVDALVMPGYSKIKKLLGSLLQPPRIKAAAEMLAAADKDAKVHRFLTALAELEMAFDHGDAMIQACETAVTESAASFEDASGRLLAALRS